MFYICICKTVTLYVPRYVVRVNKIQFNTSTSLPSATCSKVAQRPVGCEDGRNPNLVLDAPQFQSSIPDLNTRGAWGVLTEKG